MGTPPALPGPAPTLFPHPTCKTLVTHRAPVTPAPPAAADQWELVRQRLFENSDFWPMGPYEDDDGAWEDDTVYYS